MSYVTNLGVTALAITPSSPSDFAQYSITDKIKEGDGVALSIPSASQNPGNYVSFDFISFNFGCGGPNPIPAANPALACSVGVIGVKRNGERATALLTYTPSTGANSPMRYIVLDTVKDGNIKFTDLISVLIVPRGQFAVDPGNVFVIDDVKYNLRKR